LISRSGKTVNPSKNPAQRPNTGNPLRTRAKTPRVYFLEADATEDEHKAIMDHCREKKISVSEYLSELVTQDAAATKGRKATVLLKMELKLTAEQYDKLDLLAYLRKKDSIEELIEDLIQPHLDLQRLHAPEATKVLRLYLSKVEHERALKHIAERGIPARKYVSFLAIKDISKARKE
jgi:hypothetical protein